MQSYVQAYAPSPDFAGKLTRSAPGRSSATVNGMSSRACFIFQNKMSFSHACLANGTLSDGKPVRMRDRIHCYPREWVVRSSKGK